MTDPAASTANADADADSSMTDVVLIGGGHAHVHFLKSAGLSPLRETLRSLNVRVTLVTRDELTPYSGMLPGYIAGHYGEEEMHIDLRELCDWSGVRFVNASAVGVDYRPGEASGGGGGGEVRVSDGRAPIRYDALGIDVGSSPAGFFASDDDEGEETHPTVTPVKPISSFSARYAALASRLRYAASDYSAERPFVLLVVGGGAGGVEVALAAQVALGRVMAEATGRGGTGSGKEGHALKVLLATRGNGLLEGHNAKVRKVFARILRERNVEVRYGTEGVGVAPPPTGSTGDGDDGMSTLILSDNSASQSPIHFHECLWCTSARAPPFLASDTPFATTPSGGFLLVEDTYQCQNHPGVFASGDCCHMSAHPRPKAGVFAVRAGPIITENIMNYLIRKPLRRHKPQSEFLGLISTGDKYAVMSRGQWALEGAYLWRLKDRIDRKWMEGYQKLPPKNGKR